MNTVTRVPYRSWNLRADFDDLINGNFASAKPVSSREHARIPAMDIVETDQGYEVKTDLPGVKKEDLSVSVKEDVLTIEARSSGRSEGKEGVKVIQQERHAGRYVRTLRLGKSIDEAGIAAEYADGVLKLTLPKAEKATSRQIDVAVH